MLGKKVTLVKRIALRREAQLFELGLVRRPEFEVIVRRPGVEGVEDVPRGDV